MAGDTTIRQFFARIGFDLDRTSLRAADRQLNAIKVGLQGLAGILVAGRVTKGLIDAVKGTAELADEIKSAAARIGLSTTALQELRFAGGLANVSAEELQNGMKLLSRNAFEAANGSKEAGEGFRALGVRVTDSNGKVKTAEQLLTELGDGFARTKSETEKVALAQKVFGRSGTALLPLLNQGSAAIAAQRRELHDLGGVLDEELIELGDEFTDSQLRLKAATQGVKNVLAKALLPTIIRTIDGMKKWVAANRQWIGQGIAKAVRDFVVVLSSVSRAIAEVVRFNIEFVRSLTPLQKGLIGVLAVAALLAAVFASPALTMLLFLSLLALIIQDFEVFRAGGKSAIGDLLEAVDELLDGWGDVGEAIRGVGRNVKFVFELATNIIGTFVEFVGNILEGEFSFAFETVFARIRTMWADTIEFMVSQVELAARLAKNVLPAGFVDFAAGLATAGLKLQGAVGSKVLGEKQAGIADATRNFVVASALPSVQGSVSSIVNAPVTINPAPGMSPEQIGIAVGEQIAARMSDTFRFTRDAFSPAR